VNVPYKDGDNLDALSDEQLTKVFKYLKPFLYPLNSDIGRIGKYIICKKTAIKIRLGGEIETALKYERECDSIHKSLSDKYRW